MQICPVSIRALFRDNAIRANDSVTINALHQLVDSIGIFLEVIAITGREINDRVFLFLAFDLYIGSGKGKYGIVDDHVIEFVQLGDDLAEAALNFIAIIKHILQTNFAECMTAY
jgi:hypothetical protein